jgi:hypothetical protein
MALKSLTICGETAELAGLKRFVELLEKRSKPRLFSMGNYLFIGSKNVFKCINYLRGGKVTTIPVFPLLAYCVQQILTFQKAKIRPQIAQMKAWAGLRPRGMVCEIWGICGMLFSPFEERVIALQRAKCQMISDAPH